MTDVLIVGAGPTGLVLALWLTKQGVRVRIIDRTDGPGQTSRAMVVQARTLELYRQLELADATVAAGNQASDLNLWVRGKRRAHIFIGGAGASITPYPFLLVYPQDQHERLLIERLQDLGVRVERRTELDSFEDRGDSVLARLRKPNGEMETCEAQYLAGCDGARSTVRHQLGMGFEGGTYRQLFYVADVEVSGLATADQVNIALDRTDFVVLLPYGKGKQSRLIGTVSDERADQKESLTFDDVSHEAINGIGLRVDKVNWFSTYRVHHRIASNFRRGRCFLLGDAGHVHSPAGGQGMNTGILDSINLAWKLTAMIQRRATDTLLDSYEVERQAFARTLVDTTDRVFTFVTSGGSLAQFVKAYVFPTFASVAYGFQGVREFMFRTVSQTTLSYHESVLSEGQAGSVRGGDRLPWVPLPGADNYAPLSEMDWQVHIYGAVDPALKSWCDRQPLPLHVFDWKPEHQNAGLAENAAYVLRPDTYVGLADPAPSADSLDRYFRSRGIHLGSRGSTSSPSRAH